MKTTFVAFVSIFFSVFTYADSESNPPLSSIDVGDSREQVKDVMGEPNGFLESGDFAIYYYKLGTVKFRSGKVSTLDLMSEEEWQRRQQAQEKAREARRIKGEEVLAKVSDDPHFAELPAENRLAFWKKFQEDYPDADVYIPYSHAKIEVEKKREQQREQQRIAKLERRVERAEMEAKRAADTAATQRDVAYTRYYNSLYPRVIVYPQSYTPRKPHRKTRHSWYSSGNRFSVNAPGISFTLGRNYRKQRNTTNPLPQRDEHAKRGDGHPK
jgi:hypothetical protein